MLLLRDMKTSLFCEINPIRQEEDTDIPLHVINKCTEHELSQIDSLSLDSLSLD